MLINQHPDLFWGLIASMFVGNILLLITNLPLVGVWASLLKVDFSLLMPIITFITFTGAFAINSSIFDLGVMTFAGLIGFWLKAGGYDLSALSLGMFLGKTLEQNLITTMVMYDGSLISMIFDRPIGGTFMVIIILIIIYLAGQGLRGYMRGRIDKQQKGGEV